MAAAVRLIYRKNMSNVNLSAIRALVLDMDGVIWKDTEPIGDLPAIFRTLQEKNIQYVFATNNATRTAEEYLKKLNGMGVKDVGLWQIINSQMAVGFLLKKSYPEGGPIYIIGEQGLKNHLKSVGFYEDDQDPLAVVVGLDRAINYDMLTRATLLIRSGKRFIGTNPDKTYPVPAGLIPGAGAIITTVAVSTDVEPEYAGKPSPAMFQLALERLGTSSDETMAVGDRLETDLAGGQIAGMRTAMVLTGVANRNTIAAWNPPPDVVADDLTDLVRMLG
jgi:4-nitrophenyl phosphatase